MGVSVDHLCASLLALPGVTQAPCYGTPGFRVRGKLFARLWPDGETLVLKMDTERREMLLETQPDLFFLTDHYRSHPYILVRLGAIDSERFDYWIRESWRIVAPKSLASALAAKT
jgi:hypothetical protein